MHVQETKELSPRTGAASLTVGIAKATEMKAAAAAVMREKETMVVWRVVVEEREVK